LIALKPLFRNDYQDNELPIDQVLSGSAKYVFPKEHAEVYFEYGWNDGSSNSRDLMLDLSHSTASIFGFRKLQYINKKTYLSIEAEATRMSQTPSYLQRNAGNWYTHSQIKEGYLNDNQILGAGSGLGNNVQTLTLSWNNAIEKYGIKFQHIAQNPLSVINILTASGGDRNWDDYCYGVIIKNKYKNIVFNLNIDWVNSKNYLWAGDKKTSNLFIFLNTIYLW
jgi:hypothetical protein